MAHWYEVFNGVHVTFGVVRGPQEVIDDPQLRVNDIVVPLEGAGGKLTSTISSPIQVHGVAKVPHRRAPELGEHNEEILEAAGFRRGRDRRLAREWRHAESEDAQRNSFRKPERVPRTKATAPRTTQIGPFSRIATTRMPTSGECSRGRFEQDGSTTHGSTSLAIDMCGPTEGFRCCYPCAVRPGRNTGSLRCDSTTSWKSPYRPSPRKAADRDLRIPGRTRHR